MKTILHAYKQNLRILKFLHKINRNAIPMMIAKAFLESIFPYINFVFMAFIIDALLVKHWEMAFYTVTGMICIQLFLGIIIEAINGNFELTTMSINRKSIQQLCNHNLCMDFGSLEDKEGRKELERAEFCAASNGGFGWVILETAEVLKSVFSFFISIGFIVVLCFKTSVVSNSLLQFILSPIGSLGILSVLLFMMFLIYAKIARKANNGIVDIFNEKLEFNQEQRYLQDQVFMDYGKAKEIRLYKMQGLFLHLNQLRLFPLLSYIAKELRYMNKIRVNGTILNDLLNIIVYVFVALKVYAKAITIGSFIQFVSAFQQMNIALRTFIEKTNSIIELNTYLIYFLDFIEEENKMCTGSLPIEKEKIMFMKLSFIMLVFIIQIQRKRFCKMYL